MSDRPAAVVVGAGMAGLRCAIELQRSGIDVTVLEAGDAPGGRVRTDVIDGFRIDRGFQVLLTAYPEARAIFDYAALDLRAFTPGALCRRDGRFATIADPVRRPGPAVASLVDPVASIADLPRLIRLYRTLRRGTLRDLFARPETTTAARLAELGLSPSLRDVFLRPFLSGIFLEPELETSSRLFEFVLRMMATGDTAVPAQGMGALSAQLAGMLPDGTIRLGARVRSVEPNAVTLDTGERIEAAAVVVATAGLLPEVEPPAWRSVTTYAFDAAEAPLHQPTLLLDGAGPVINCHVASAVAAEVAPAGRALVSASVLGLAPAGTETAVRAQLAAWFGPAVADWRLVQELRIERALPAVPPRLRQPRLASGIYACGDHLMGPTLNAALATGRRAGTAVAAALGATAVSAR